MLKSLLRQQSNAADLAISFLLRSRPRAPWTLITEGSKLPVVGSFAPHVGAEQAAARTWINTAQRHGRGVLHLIGETETPLHRPMTEEEIVASAAIAIDIGGTPEQQRARCAALPQPTALIATGRGVTALYALRDRLPMATVTQIGKPLAARAEGELVWLVPVPGTLRKSGQRVTIIDYNPQRLFSAAELMPAAPGKRRRVVRADKIAPAHVDWLWRHMIPKGELTVIGGFGSAGKTTMCLGLCATITREGAWPDGTQAPPGRALVIEGEDPVDTVTVPRLLAAGADLSRVTIVDQGEDMLTAADLEEAAAGLDDLRLVVLSPIRRLIHDNASPNTEIRRRLEPLIDWAKARRCGLVGVMHPVKGNTKQRADALAGSPAYTELARAVHVAAIDGSDPEPMEIKKRRALVSAKANLAPAGLVYLYRIDTAWAGEIETSRVVWLTPGAEREQNRSFPVRSAPPAAPPPPIYRTPAQAWLAAKLAEGPMQAALLEKWAGESGISRASLYRAATALGVIRTACPGGGKSWQARNR
ncbi:MAG: AAA family ATPase [Pseudomonadota bacterium]|nr:AAA family ATPase [Pseudomonadota bacterium]